MALLTATVALAGALALGISVAAAKLELQARSPTQVDHIGAATGRVTNSPVLVENPRRPANLVIVDRQLGAAYTADLGWTDDGGHTWGRTVLPLPRGVTAEPFDADVAFGADGTLYVAYLNLHGRGHTPEHLWLSRSADGGRTLLPPVALAGALSYQPRIATGPGGLVVVTYLQASAVGQLSLVGPTAIEAVTTTDGGVTFAPPVQVSDASRSRVGGAVPLIAADGSAVVVYEDFKADVRDFLDLEGPVWPDPFALVVTRSTDSGVTFSGGRELDSAVAATQRFVPFEPTFASVAAGPGSSVTVVWADGQGNGSQVVLRQSSDLGATWGPRQSIGDGHGGGEVHRLPTVAVSPGGRIDLLDLESRPATSIVLDAWLASSRDGGRSFSHVDLGVAALDARSGASLGSPFTGPDLGTGLGLISDASASVSAWPGGGVGQGTGIAVARVDASVPGALARMLAAGALLLLALAATAVAAVIRWPARALSLRHGLGSAAVAAAAYGRAALAGPSIPLSAPVGAPRLRLGRRAYPVVLPSLRDPRLHVAAALISVQVLGQVALGFQLSVAQILLAMGACALTEVAITFVQRRQIIWPASALLTGNGVALLLRVPGTAHGDWWSLNGAGVFLFAALVSLLSKYAIRFRGRHIFNPSNVGLVICFLVFGSTLSDPQDLWWGPLGPGLGLTLAIIVVAGLLITRRLRMLSIVIAFMASFAAFVGVITLGGHCVSARWHVGPLCGERYWSVLVSSPEILIFMFFMITDPQTTPRSRGGRIAYGIGVALVAALLAAPQRTEFATKVAVLGGLVVICAALPLARALRPVAAAWGARLLDEVTGAVVRAAGRGAAAAARTLALGSAALVSFAACVGLLLIAAIPAQHSAATAPAYSANAAQIAGRPLIPVDPSALPAVSIDPSVPAADPSITPATARSMAFDVVQDLLIAATASDALDAHRAATAEVGPLLQRTIASIATERQTGRRTVPSYRFSALRLVLARNPADYQASLEVTVEVRATVTTVIYSGLTGQQTAGQTTSAMDRIFVIQLLGGHFLLAGDYTR